MKRYHSYNSDSRLYKLKRVAQHIAFGTFILFVASLFLGIIWVIAFLTGGLGILFAILGTLLVLAGSVWAVASYIEDEV